MGEEGMFMNVTTLDLTYSLLSNAVLHSLCCSSGYALPQITKLQLGGNPELTDIRPVRGFGGTLTALELIASGVIHLDTMLPPLRNLTHL